MAGKNAFDLASKIIATCPTTRIIVLALVDENLERLEYTGVDIIIKKSFLMKELLCSMIALAR